MPPRAASSPKPQRTPSSRTKKTPQRLGTGDGWGSDEIAARDWTGAGASEAVAKASSPAKSPAKGKGKGSKSRAQGVSDFALLAVALGAWVYVFGTPTFTKPSSELMKISAAISLPQFFYVFVWKNSVTFAGWCKAMGAKPVNIFECIVLAGKVAQQLLLLTWMDGFDKGTTLFTGANDEAKALCIALVVLGQGLNIAVYLSLGKNNVYYGTKLGAPVSWVTGFPYGTGFRHPQYVGGFVSQLGVLALSTDAEAPALAAWWGALYLVNAIVEESE